MHKYIWDMLGTIDEMIWRCNELLPRDQRRPGGYLCVLDKSEQTPIVVARIGVPEPKKVEKYFSLCQEKALRLRNHPDHLSSWQTRDPEKNQFGGAIRAGQYILAFSGLVEKADEAMLVKYCSEHGMLSALEVQMIQSISKNELIQ